MIKIAPSILSADFSNLGSEIQMLNKGQADLIHIDVMDGHFVPNLTIGPVVVKAIKPYTTIPFDVHLMMDNPMDYIDAFIDAGANILTVHAEVLPHLHRSVNYIKNKGVKVAVALNPSTPLNILEYIIQDLDMVLLMTVNPGFGGQSFIPSMINKIHQLKGIIDERNLDIDIQVDGGISLKNINDIVAAGANCIVAGSCIFNSADPINTIKQLREAGVK